jgi:hypothetical protein
VILFPDVNVGVPLAFIMPEAFEKHNVAKVSAPISFPRLTGLFF